MSECERIGVWQAAVKIMASCLSVSRQSLFVKKQMFTGPESFHLYSCSQIISLCVSVCCTCLFLSVCSGLFIWSFGAVCLPLYLTASCLSSRSLILLRLLLPKDLLVDVCVCACARACVCWRAQSCSASELSWTRQRPKPGVRNICFTLNWDIYHLKMNKRQPCWISTALCVEFRNGYIKLSKTKKCK